MEVRGAIDDRTEFDLPSNEIIPNGEEVLAGVKSWANDLLDGKCGNYKTNTG